MDPLFTIGVYREENGNYGANVFSFADNQGKAFTGPTLKGVLAEASKAVRKRQNRNLRFPPAEPSNIIKPNGFDAPKLIVRS